MGLVDDAEGGWDVGCGVGWDVGRDVGWDSFVVGGGFDGVLADRSTGRVVSAAGCPSEWRSSLPFNVAQPIPNPVSSATVTATAPVARRRPDPRMAPTGSSG